MMTRPIGEARVDWGMRRRPRPAWYRPTTPALTPSSHVLSLRGTGIAALLVAALLVTPVVAGCAAPSAAEVPVLSSASAAVSTSATASTSASAAVSTSDTGSTSATVSEDAGATTAREPMSSAPLLPLPTARPTSPEQRAAESVAVVRHYLTAAVIALRGGDPAALDSVAGPACACRSVVRDAARFRAGGGVTGFEVWLAGAREVDALGTDVSVIGIDYTIPAHVEPPGPGTSAVAVAGSRVRAEVSVRWTGTHPVVDRVRVVRRWPA